MITWGLDSGLYEEVAECGEWDYSWHIGKLLREKATGQLYWGETVGCSCNDFWENIEAKDLVPVDNWQASVVLATESFTEAEVYEFARELAALR